VQTITLIKIILWYVQHVFTKPLKRCARRLTRGDWGESFKTKWRKTKIWTVWTTLIGKDFFKVLPSSGSEREIIEYYFYKGFEYKNIVLFLQRYTTAYDCQRELFGVLCEVSELLHSPLSFMLWRITLITWK
jgi:hypothetical protein